VPTSFPTAIEQIDGQRFAFYGMADQHRGSAWTVFRELRTGLGLGVIGAGAFAVVLSRPTTCQRWKWSPSPTPTTTGTATSRRTRPARSPV
jgi:hypothetical protein